MKLLLPNPGMLYWSIFAIVSFVMLMAGLVKLLINDNQGTKTKLVVVGLVGILFVPTFGGLFYLTNGRR
ncbi:hypothetical protein [Parasediminibacterium sp. JCM 36343]|uniref:hypothetical protein n=1 Tax=Parasediminibacterium sp. JCM 36343 TaxID=3374279 RepID=UPI0039798C3B